MKKRCHKAELLQLNIIICNAIMYSRNTCNANYQCMAGTTYTHLLCNM